MITTLAKTTKAITLALTFMLSSFQSVSQPAPVVASVTKTPLPNIQVRQIQIETPVAQTEFHQGISAEPAEGELSIPDSEPIRRSELTPFYGEEYVCTIIWRATPPEGEAPYWLSTPDSPEGLYTDVPYTYLAGSLIRNGVIDASECPNDGLLPNGAADTCGLEAARTAVTEWQNQFNEPIYSFANANALPAVLLKRVFATESQFWFGISLDGYHAGLGHTTPIGLDPLFLYYPNYYNTICPLLFSDRTCEGTYSELSSEEKAMMRGYLYNTRVDATCPACPYGVDLDKATSSIDIFAKLINSNCHQTNTLFLNITEGYAGSNASYEDLWKFTMGNYTAGPGCMGDAYLRTYNQGEEFTWENVSRNLVGACEAAIPYVEAISY